MERDRDHHLVTVGTGGYRHANRYLAREIAEAERLRCCKGQPSMLQTRTEQLSEFTLDRNGDDRCELLEVYARDQRDFGIAKHARFWGAKRA